MHNITFITGTNKNILWQEFGSGELLLIHSPFSLQLTQGTLVTVPPSLVKRCKNHFHNMLCGASIILGNNGYIWISPIVSDDHQQPQYRFQTPTGVSSIEKEEKVSTSKFIILVFSLDTMLLIVALFPDFCCSVFLHGYEPCTLTFNIGSDKGGERDNSKTEKLHSCSGSAEGHALRHLHPVHL